MSHVVILGGGPAGAGAALQLRRQNKARVTLVERGSGLGGNAGSFDWEGQRLDFGSHRLHRACAPAILDDIRGLLGPDLLDRPRHGRIRLRGRWIHFPLKAVDLMLRLDPRFGIGTLWDMAAKVLPGGNDGRDDFASVLRANLGRTICRDFYFPYARKIWGHEPGELSGIQARKRVSAGTFGKLLRKVIPGLNRSGGNRFYYPVRGYGQITEAYAQAAAEAGADIRTQRSVRRLVSTGSGWEVETEGPEGAETIVADWVWSTIPITAVARMIDPPPPENIIRDAQSIGYRAMLLVYLKLPVPQFTEFDAHYFPGANITITRLSEPKNYSALSEPAGSTVLCAELPCAVDDELWTSSDEQLGDLVVADLRTAGIPVPAPPAAVRVQRLPQAYPIYLSGYEKHFAPLDGWAEAVPRLLTYGRQGLFAHDNTHHALAMAYAAVDCFHDGEFDDARWAAYRAEFATHVVED